MNNDADYFTKHHPPIQHLSNATSVYTYLEFSEGNYSDHKIMQGCVEPSAGYSVPCRFHKDNTSKTTIYDQEISYGQTVKPLQKTHNVAQ